MVRLDEQVATMTDSQAKLEARRELLATQEGTSRVLCLNVSSAWSNLTQLKLFSHVPPLGELNLLLEAREEERRHAEESNMKAKKDSLEAEKTIAELDDEQAIASDEHRRLSALAVN